MAKKQTFTYQDGDFVVYPTHGVGKINGTENQKIAGAEVTLLVIRFEQDRMTLRVPLEKAMTLGLRTLSSRKHMDDAITTLKSKARVKRAMWSRRAQEYEQKINSGDLIAIAEVVRDLHRKDDQREQSYSERQLYEAALERLTREIAAVDRADEDAAQTKIEEVLTSRAA